MWETDGEGKVRLRSEQLGLRLSLAEAEAGREISGYGYRHVVVRKRPASWHARKALESIAPSNQLPSPSSSPSSLLTRPGLRLTLVPQLLS